MDTDLETNFDVIVIGTGFTESLVAAGAARIGKKVLHLDRNEYYGGQWASFSLSCLEDWVKDMSSKQNPSALSQDMTRPVSEYLQDGESVVTLADPDSVYFGVKSMWHIPDSAEEGSNSIAEGTEENSVMKSGQMNDSEERKEKSAEMKDDSEKRNEETAENQENKDLKQLEDKYDYEIKVRTLSKEDLLNLRRKFNIDLAPKILYSRGALVELLISSNVARYLEFKCISRILTWMKDNSSGDSDEESAGSLVVVPCCRSDVFMTEVVDFLEKRLLMKFLQLCHKYEENAEDWKDYAGKPFNEFLLSQKLTPSLVHFVTCAIAMVDKDTECTEGLRRTAHFLNSLGRYGTMPFLFSLYGSGEMPQAFCRLCAVFEGVYILRRKLDGIVVDEEKNISGLSSEGQIFRCKNLVMDSGYTPASYLQDSAHTKSISRGIFLTDRSVMKSEKEHLTLLRMPAMDSNQAAVTVLEVGYCTGVCPRDTYIVHLTCDGENAEADLAETVKVLFTNQKEAERPNILYSLYFNRRLHVDEAESVPQNLHLCSGPDSALDYDDAITQAKNIFLKMFPEAEFLPRAPDPEEIVFEGESAPEGATGFNQVEEVSTEPSQGNATEYADSAEEALAKE